MKRVIKGRKRKVMPKGRSKKRIIKGPIKRKSKRIAKARIKGIKAQPVVQEFAEKGVPAEAQKNKVEQAKYYPRPSTYMPPREWEKEELPSHYGDNKVVVLVRDPYWLYAYWEITDERKSNVETETQASWSDLRKVLRVNDVTDIIFDGTNANKSFDIDPTSDANNWYIHVGEPNRSWCVDLGAVAPDGRFILIARSNVVTTPRDSASDVIDEEWMSLEEEFAKLYGLFGGFGVSSPQMVELRKKMKERLQMELASGAVSSFARPPLERGFWLVVNTELIVYGATEPSATVTVQGRSIKLNRDGTFSLRLALPAGEQVIPVKAISADKAEERTITPVVRKYIK